MHIANSREPSVFFPCAEERYTGRKRRKGNPIAAQFCRVRSRDSQLADRRNTEERRGYAAMNIAGKQL